MYRPASYNTGMLASEVRGGVAPAGRPGPAPAPRWAAHRAGTRTVTLTPSDSEPAERSFTEARVGNEAHGADDRAKRRAKARVGFILAVRELEGRGSSPASAMRGAVRHDVGARI